MLIPHLIRQIRRLKEEKLLISEHEGKRKYFLSFRNRPLMRGIIHTLGKNGFLPVNDPI